MKKNRSVVRSLGLMGVTLLLVLLATTVVFAGRGDGDFTATPLQGEVVSVDAAKPQVTADRSASRVDPTSLRPVSIIVTLDAAVSDAELEAVSGGEVVHRYTKVFDGASLVLPEGNIEAVSKMDRRLRRLSGRSPPAGHRSQPAVHRRPHGLVAGWWCERCR